MKQKWVEAFMDTAERFAQLSYAKRLQVGAVVVKDNRIISIGYNGTPAGWDNECEKTVRNSFSSFGDSGVVGSISIVTKDEVIHAEANAISKLARSVESGVDSDMFITHAPCIHCAKLIYGAGIKSVYFKNLYRDDSGLVFLEKCGVKTIKV